MCLDEDFDKACENVKNLNKKPTDKDLLVLYGLYKQGTCGTNTDKKPAIFDIAKISKWNAWYENRMLSKNMAKKKYVQIVDEFKIKYGYEKN